MRQPLAFLALLSACGLAACGGGTAVQPDPASATSSASAEASAAASPAGDAPPAAGSSASDSGGIAVPAACAEKGADVCAPPTAFVERLCARQHQEAALVLFVKASPFTRMYLRGKLDELAWDEEVLVLRYHGAPKGGIQVGNSTGSYDVLRWDGSCSMSVDAEMLTKNRPARPKTARVQWHRLGDKTQTALVAGSDVVKKAHARRGKECKGAMSGDVSSGCEKADAALGDAIVEYVRGGGALPDVQVF